MNAMCMCGSCEGSDGSSDGAVSNQLAVVKAVMVASEVVMVQSAIS